MSNYNPTLHSPLRDVSRTLAAEADAKAHGTGNGTATPNGVIGKEVRENLFASISHTSHPLTPGTSGAQGPASASLYHHDISAHQHHAMTRSLSHRNITASHPTSPSHSRPDSPYTVNPPIDFDGLSWPSVGAKARKEQTPEEQQATMEKLSGA